MVVIQDIGERESIESQADSKTKRPFRDRGVLRVWLTRLLVGLASRPARFG
jgi:hypothetical protein